MIGDLRDHLILIFQIFDIHNTVAQDCTVTVTHCFIDLSGHEIEKKKVYFAEITNMVCEKCEKKGKLGKVITPDPWKAGASNTTKPGGRKVGENKLLTASKNRFNPLTTEFKKCRICKVCTVLSSLICLTREFKRIGQLTPGDLINYGS